jgi:hypothetical protein
VIALIQAESTSRRGAAARLPDPARGCADPHEELARDLGTGASGFTTRGLGTEPENLRQARAFVRAWPERWGLRSCSDEVTLVADELVSSAVCHGLQPTAHHATWPSARLGLACQDGTLVCAVKDPSPEVSVLGQADELLECGRGLRIIAR